MKTLLQVLAVLIGINFASFADAATLSATPETFNAVFRTAKSGDKVALSPGKYVIAIKNVSFSPSVVIDARAATIGVSRLDNVNGLTIDGGTYDNGCPLPTGAACYNYSLRATSSSNLVFNAPQMIGPERSSFGIVGVKADGYGLGLTLTKNVKVAGGVFAGYRNAMVLSGAQNVDITNNRFTMMRADGISMGYGTNDVRIEHNVFEGTSRTAQEHPDAIQGFNRPTHPPVSDIFVRWNTIVGDMQGIFFANHNSLYQAGTVLADGTVLKAPTTLSDGAYRNIVIEYNYVTTGFPAGITLINSKGGAVRHNRVATLPGSKYFTNIAISGEDIEVCGNDHIPAYGKRVLVDPECVPR